MTKLNVLCLVAVSFAVACGGSDDDRPELRDAAAETGDAEPCPDGAVDSESSNDAPNAVVDAGPDTQPGCSGAVLIAAHSVTPYVPNQAWQITLRLPTTLAKGPCVAEQGVLCSADVELSMPAEAEPPQIYVHDHEGLPITGGQLHPTGCGVQEESFPGTDPLHTGETYTINYEVTEQ